MAKILQDAFSPDEDEKDPQVSGEADELSAPAEDDADDLLADESSGAPEESDDLLAEEEDGHSDVSDGSPNPGSADRGGASEFDSGDSDSLLGGDPDHLNLVQGDLDAEGFDDALAGSEWRGQQDGEPDSPDAVRQKAYGENHFGNTGAAMFHDMSPPSDDDSAS